MVEGEIILLVSTILFKKIVKKSSNLLYIYNKFALNIVKVAPSLFIIALNLLKKPRLFCLLATYDNELSLCREKNATY
jgi:hypothetical protein